MNHTKLFSNHVLFTALLIMAVIGVAVSDISATASHLYWISMVVLFGIVSIFANYSHTATYDQAAQKKAIVIQTLHWMGGLVTVMIVYTLLSCRKDNPGRDWFNRIVNTRLNHFSRWYQDKLAVQPCRCFSGYHRGLCGLMLKNISGKY
ncbi:hypothetical protein [Methyloglobulus sp.]|uniref:hypothetical protein n=1 Tax=Methyloglobulus sp. TaxID=2518622 RepID=UPI003988C366